MLAIRNVNVENIKTEGTVLKDVDVSSIFLILKKIRDRIYYYIVLFFFLKR